VLGSEFSSALELLMFRVGWVERSDTQHNPCKPFHLDARNKFHAYEGKHRR